MKTKLLESIKRHEGWRDKAYQDTEGIWTIGYGRNLQELTIDTCLGTRWLKEDIRTATDAAEKFPEWECLNTDPRQDVFIEMVFNMGPSRVAGFRNMLAAFRDEDWARASREMLDSKWARQVGVRAGRLAKIMLDGKYDG